MMLEEEEERKRRRKEMDRSRRYNGTNNTPVIELNTYIAFLFPFNTHIRETFLLFSFYR